MAGKALDNLKFGRWRSFAAQDILPKVSDYSEQEHHLQLRTCRESTRCHLTASGRDFEILCNEPKFLNPRNAKGDGEVADLSVGQLGPNFEQAVRPPLSKGG
jgi:hypothetical protein